MKVKELNPKNNELEIIEFDADLFPIPQILSFEEAKKRFGDRNVYAAKDDDNRRVVEVELV